MARKKIDEELEAKILLDLKNNLTYSQIVKKHNLKSKSLINRIKKQMLDSVTVSEQRYVGTGNRIVKTRADAIRETALAKSVIQRSEIVVGNIIDVLEGLKYTTTNLVEINEHAKGQIDKIQEELSEIKAELQELKGQDKKIDAQIEKTLTKIENATNNIGAYYSKQRLRIDALSSLKDQFKVFQDYEITARAMNGIKILIKDFFETLNLISDNEYIKFRTELIRRNPAVKGLFEEYEAEIVNQGQED